MKISMNLKACCFKENKVPNLFLLIMELCKIMVLYVNQFRIRDGRRLLLHRIQLLRMSRCQWQHKQLFFNSELF
jgi:hypothetical protein